MAQVRFPAPTHAPCSFPLIPVRANACAAHRPGAHVPCAIVAGANLLLVQDTSKQLYMGDAVARLLLPALSVANTLLSAPGVCSKQ